MTTRVLIVDDHPVFRDGLAALLASVDEASDGHTPSTHRSERAADSVRRETDDGLARAVARVLASGSTS
jgi:DNA-binding NarL/FixJ family response regulator